MNGHGSFGGSVSYRKLNLISIYIYIVFQAIMSSLNCDCFVSTEAPTSSQIPSFISISKIKSKVKKNNQRDNRVFKEQKKSLKKNLPLKGIQKREHIEHTEIKKVTEKGEFQKKESNFKDRNQHSKIGFSSSVSHRYPISVEKEPVVRRKQIYYLNPVQERLKLDVNQKPSPIPSEHHKFESNSAETSAEICRYYSHSKSKPTLLRITGKKPCFTYLSYIQNRKSETNLLHDHHNSSKHSLKSNNHNSESTNKSNIQQKPKIEKSLTIHEMVQKNVESIANSSDKYSQIIRENKSNNFNKDYEGLQLNLRKCENEESFVMSEDLISINGSYSQSAIGNSHEKINTYPY